MTPDYYDIVWLDMNEAMLFGEREDGTKIRVFLNVEQSRRVEDLQSKHSLEMRELLKALAA